MGGDARGRAPEPSGRAKNRHRPGGATWPCHSTLGSLRLAGGFSVFDREVVGDRFGDVANRVELLGRQDVGKAMPHHWEMPRGRPSDRSEPRIGEKHVETAGVVRASLTAYRSAGLHPGDLVRESAPLPLEEA